MDAAVMTLESALLAVESAGGRVQIVDGGLHVDVDIELPEPVWQTLKRHRDEIIATLAGDAQCQAEGVPMMTTSQVYGSEYLSPVLKTGGHYLTEHEAVADLLSKVNQRHWDIYREVGGWMLNPRPFADGKLSLRVDVMLDPTADLQERGWKWGPIAIECKRSDSQVGPALCQIMDYTRCIWSIRNGEHVMSRLCFLWHFKPPGGTVESMMVNNRIGGAFLRDYRRDRLVLMFNSTVAYEDMGIGHPRVANELRGGSKTGSR